MCTYQKIHIQHNTNTNTNINKNKHRKKSENQKQKAKKKTINNLNQEQIEADETYARLLMEEEERASRALRRERRQPSGVNGKECFAVVFMFVYCLVP